MTASNLNEIIPLPLSNILVEFNVRYGWDTGSVLDSYEEGIAQLMQSIAQWGFKKNEPIEGFFKGDKFVVLEGHRRLKSAQALYDQNPDKSLGEGLNPGEVWCFVSKEPENILELVASQISANASQSNTKLDIAKAVGTAFVYLPGKKSEKLQKIGDKLGISRTQAESYLEVSKLPEEIKEWMQASELGVSNITLSFSTANDLIGYYKADAANLFIEALDRVENRPETVERHGTAVTRAWLHSLASELKLGSRKAPKNNQSTNADPDSEDSRANSQPQESNNQTQDTSHGNSSIDEDDSKAPELPPEKQETNIQSVKPSSTESHSKSLEDSATKSANNTAIERAKTLILKNISLASDYFLKAESDVERGILVIELPVEVGEELQELIAVLSETNKAQINAQSKKSEDASDVLVSALPNIPF